MVVCKIPRMHLSRSYYRGGLHLCSGIIQPSFSPDARAVIIDSLQPQQTCIGSLDLHKVCSTIFYTLSDGGRRQPPVGSSGRPEQKRTESYKELVRTT